jgi:formylglycine-generating enzyme required for sulfatase activity
MDNVNLTEGNALYGTQKVRGKSANALGLYDMSGNVYEWCWDYWNSANLIPGGVNDKDPTGTTTVLARMIRGGSWYEGAANCCVSYRFNAEPSLRWNDVGFRVVCR